MKYSRSLIIVTGHSGAPVQPMVDHIQSKSDYQAIRPVGSEKAIGYSGFDIENAMSRGQAAVLATYDPSSTANLQDWAEREGINTFTVFVSAPQELSFSRAMGNAQQMKQGKPIQTLLPEIEPMNERALLEAYESGELACIDKPHYQSSMTPDDFLAKFSSIIHSEPLWRDSIEHDTTVDFEPAFGPSLEDLAGQALSRHQSVALDAGYAKGDPAMEQAPAVRQSTPDLSSSPKPRM